MGGRVRDPGAVHVQCHTALVGVVGDRAHLRRGVRGAEFGGLRDRHRERLRPVFVAPPPCLAVDQLGGELAVGCRHRQQLEPRNPLGGGVLVGVDVGGLRADHRTPARQHRLETEHVGPGAVEDGKRLDAGTEVLGDHLLQARRVEVLAVGDLVPAVGRRDGGEHLGMDSRVVVAREAAVLGVVQPQGVVDAVCHDVCHDVQSDRRRSGAENDLVRRPWTSPTRVGVPATVRRAGAIRRWV